MGGLCATVQLPFHSISVIKTSRTKTKHSSQHLQTRIWRVPIKLVASVGGRYDRATAGQRTDKDGGTGGRPTNFGSKEFGRDPRSVHSFQFPAAGPKVFPGTSLESWWVQQPSDQSKYPCLDIHWSQIEQRMIRWEKVETDSARIIQISELYMEVEAAKAGQRFTHPWKALAVIKPMHLTLQRLMRQSGDGKSEILKKKRRMMWLDQYQPPSDDHVSRKKWYWWWVWRWLTRWWRGKRCRWWWWARRGWGGGSSVRWGEGSRW